MSTSVTERAGVLSVVVVDDHRLLAESLGDAIDREVDLACLGTASSADAAEVLIRQTRPDVVVLDVRLGPADGIELLDRLLADHPGLRVLVLTGHADRGVMQRCAERGACALLPKESSVADICQAIRSARRGSFHVAPGLLYSLVAHVAAPEPNRPVLTPREHEVLRLLAEGNDPARIARTLGISLHTCRSHVQRLLVKFHAHSQLEAVSIALRLGIVDVAR